MRHKNKIHLMFWKNLRSVCIGNSMVKMVTIPAALIGARILSVIVDRVMSGEVKKVAAYSVFMLIFILIFIAAKTVAEILICKQQWRASERCRIDFLENLFDNPLNKLFRTDYGELTENLNSDMETLIKKYIELYPDMVSGALGLMGYFLFLLVQSPIAAGSLLGISFLQFIPPVIVKRHMQINYDQCREMETKITDHIAEAVKGFEIIKVYGLKQWWQAKMADYHKAYLSVGRKTDAVAAAQRSMYRLLDNILKFGTYALMGLYVMAGYCTLDIAVQAIYLSSGLFNYVKTLFSNIPEIAVSQNAENRIRKWAAEDKQEQSFPPDAVCSANLPIVIENVSYRYENDTIMDALSYQFDSDKNYMIRGSNGAGKTTLLNLVLGLILPDQGKIFLDKRFDSMAGDPSLYLFIPQHDPEYNYDVYTLYRMFDRDKQQLLFSIAKRFGLTENSMKGKAIKDLSGGERKKVFLSIGFSLQPKWLFLDEPSNNLDRHGKEILRQLIRERKGTIIISHDELLIDSADYRIKLENGRIYDESK